MKEKSAGSQLSDASFLT